MFTNQIILSIVFFISLILIVGMIVARLLYEKLHDEHFFHRLVTHRARKADWHIKERFENATKYLRYINKKTFSLLVHLIIEEIEHYFHRLTKFVKSKFPHHK